jgi:hypothetical protein
MSRLWWCCGVVGAAAVVAVLGVYALGLPQRSAFLAREEPNACGLVSNESPFGAVTACTRLGRRTPPFAHPDATVFLLLETDTGPAAVRIDYRNIRKPRGFTARAVEVPTYEAPGISHETGERIQTAVDQRGGLHTDGWTIGGDD